MKQNRSLFGTDFVVIDLGAGFAASNNILKPYHGDMTLIELDAVNDSNRNISDYKRHEFICQAIGAVEEKRVLYRRGLSNASSLTTPQPGIVQAYGLDSHFTVESQQDVDVTTLPALLKSLQIDRMDWLKTDLEGLDGPVLFSSRDLLETTLVVQAELRFQPFYEQEPTFFEVGSFMEDLGFELIQMHSESWRYKTNESEMMRDGRIAFVDAVFFLTPAMVKSRIGDLYHHAIAKQIAIACSYNYTNYAQYLLENYATDLEPATLSVLNQLIRPSSKTMLHLIRFFNAMSRYRILHPLIRRIRHGSSAVNRAASVLPDLPHVVDW